MARRGRWTKERARVVEELYEQEVSTAQIAVRVQMSLRSVQLYVNNHISEVKGDPWKPFQQNIRSKTKKVEERRDHLERIVESDCTLTQRKMAEQLPEQLKCSTKTISNGLKSLGLVRKRLRKIPIERNTPANIQLRKSYATSIFRKQDFELYFLDETGFNLHNGPQFGYAPRGETPHITQPGNRGRNISVLVCIGIRGVVHWECIDGPYNSDKFVAFLDNLCPLIESDTVDELRQRILVMDNAVIHKTNAVKLKLESLRQDFKYLPPYSPQLNPIEEFFSALKSNQSSIRPRPKTNAQLKESIEKAIEITSRLDLRGFYQHMRHYLLIAKTGNPFV